MKTMKKHVCFNHFCVRVFACLLLCIMLFGMTAIAVEYKGTATAIPETVTSELGTLIWKQDFDSASSVGDYAYDASYVSPYAESGASLGNPDYVYAGDGDGSNPTFTVVNNPKGSGKVLSVFGTSAYPIYQLRFNGNVFSKPGKYTLSYKAYSTSAVNNVCRFYMNKATSVSEYGEVALKTDGFNTYTFSITLISPAEFASSGLSDTAFTRTHAYTIPRIYLFQKDAEDVTTYYDDIELWYEEFATITYHVDGPNAYVTNAANNAVPKKEVSIRVGSSLPDITLTGTPYVFTGWSTSKDGSTGIVTTAQSGMTDLYAIYTLTEGAEDFATAFDLLLDACRLHAKANGATVPTTEEACMTYAKANGLFELLHTDNLYRAAYKFEVALLLDAALPASSKKAINTVNGIPDVRSYHEFYEATMALYKAGILSGGEFHPFDNITNDDYTAVKNRVENTSSRLTFTMNTEYENDPMKYENEKRTAFDASFIAAPDSYLCTLVDEPASTLSMGKWITTWVSRQLMRYDFTVSKAIRKAELEFQSDNPFDFYVNGNQVEGVDTETADGWHVSGVVDITSLMTTGTNRFALRGYTSDDPLHSVSALRGCIRITYTDGTSRDILTDGNWKFHQSNNFWADAEPDGWINSTPSSSFKHVSQMELHPRELRQSLYFRKDFDVNKNVKSATLYTAGRGEYVPYINGERVTDGRFLAGAMVTYTEYQMFDVTGLLSSGTNALAAYTGNGRSNSTSWGSLGYNKNAVLMQLDITYTDGTSVTVGTDDTWKLIASPLIDNDIQFGERYDARREIENWNKAGTPTDAWVNAIETVPSGLKPFASQTYSPVKIWNENIAVSIGSTPDGAVLYDFGTNSSGRAKITLKNTKPGEMVIIRYCEVIDPVSGVPAISLYNDVFYPSDNLPNGKSPYGGRNIDVYICKGAEEEVYLPEFAYTGFRYVYVTGYTGEYDYETVRKVEMNTYLEETGDIVTSHEGIAKIWDAVKRSYRSNTFSGPTDCPTREKNFWNGDILNFVNTACWYMDNNDYLARWTESGYKAMGVNVYGWEDEEYGIPLTLYRYYGNKEVLETKYPTIQALIAKREAAIPSGEILPTGPSPYNDHSSVQNVPADFFSAASFCRMYKESAEIAEILGKTEDAATYRKKFEEARAAFNLKYYVPDEKTYSPRVQGAVIIPVAFGIPDDDMVDGLLETLNAYVVDKDYHLTCGFTSMEFALGLLCDGGHADTAWKTITQTTSPSMLNMLTNHTGGTTTESWMGYTGGDTFASMNHYAIGSIARWFFNYLGGIRDTSAGFKTFRVEPTFIAEMGDANVTYDSVSGHIASAWVYDKDDKTFSWTVTVPEGTTATVGVPDGFAFMENGVNTTTDKTVTGGVYTYTICSHEGPVAPDTIVCIGDSLTQGDYGSNPPGTMNVKEENFPFFLGQLTGSKVINAGRCGYSPSLYYNNMLSNVAMDSSTEMILIMLGTNGGLTDTIDADVKGGDYTKYAETETGYYARIIEYCIQKTSGNAKIILMTPPVTTLRDRTIMETTVDVIKQFGNMYGLPVIDNYNECGITYENISTYMPIDGLHCGREGYELLATYIAEQVLMYYRGSGEYSLNYARLDTEKVGYVGRWHEKTVDGKVCKATIAPGAEFYFEVKNTSTVTLSLASLAEKAPYLAVSIDGREPVRMLSPLTGNMVIAENLSLDRHEFRIIVDSLYEYQYQKWQTGNGFVLKDVLVDDGGTVRGLVPQNPTIMYFGDSITEGVAIFEAVSSPEANSAMYEYPFVTSHALGAVSHTNGFGGSGITKGGSGGIPKCLTVIDQVIDGIPNDAPEPDMIVINHGHNDLSNGTLIPEVFGEEYTAVLTRLREKYPNAKIFAVVPYVQRYPDVIEECVSAMNDSNIFFIPTAGWKYSTSDSAHPDAAGARALGLKLAEAITKTLENAGDTSAPKIDVTFVTGTNSETIALTPGSTIVKRPSVVGQTFLGWSLTKNGTTYVTKVPTTPTTLYAVFRKQSANAPASLGDFPYIEDGLGKVVVYADGSSLEAFTYSDSGITLMEKDKIMTSGCTVEIVDDPDGTGKVTWLRSASAETYKPTYGTFTLKNGNYHLSAEYYVPKESTVTSTMTGLGNVQFVLGTIYNAKNTGFTPSYLNGNKETWVKYVSAPVIAKESSITYEGNAISDTELQYRWVYSTNMSVDVNNADAGIYVKNYAVYYYPENAFMLADDGELQLIEVTSATATLPTPTTGDIWVTDDNTVYHAGDVVDIAEIEHKTLRAADSTLYVTIGDPSETTETTVDFGKQLSGAVVAAAFHGDGRLADAKVIAEAELYTGVVKVNSAKGLDVKVFVFDDISTLHPAA